MGVSACWLGYLAQKSCVHFAKCLPSKGFTEWVTTILFSYSYACVASLPSMMHGITAFDFYCWPCPYNLLGSSGISRLTGKEKLNMLALNKWLVLYTDKLGSLESQSESFFFSTNAGLLISFIWFWSAFIHSKHAVFSQLAIAVLISTCKKNEKNCFMGIGLCVGVKMYIAYIVCKHKWLLHTSILPYLKCCMWGVVVVNYIHGTSFN